MALWMLYFVPYVFSAQAFAAIIFGFHLFDEVDISFQKKQCYEKAGMKAPIDTQLAIDTAAYLYSLRQFKRSMDRILK